MSVSKEYMQQKYGHLGEFVVVKKNGKNRTCIKMSCENCGTEFLRPVYAWNRNKIFCSHKCNGDYYKPLSTPIEDYILDYDGIMKPRIKCKSFGHWKDMIMRTTDSWYKEIKPTYKDCTVSENFKGFNYFHDWCLQQRGYGLANFELDKDILIKGNKHYSEDTCCLVPKQINMLFIYPSDKKSNLPLGVSYNKSNGYYVSCVSTCDGKIVKYSKTPEEAFIKYKEDKENHIKSMANKFKDSISDKVYERLIGYEIEDVRSLNGSR